MTIGISYVFVTNSQQNKFYEWFIILERKSIEKRI